MALNERRLLFKTDSPRWCYLPPFRRHERLKIRVKKLKRLHLQINYKATNEGRNDILMPLKSRVCSFSVLKQIARASKDCGVIHRNISKIKIC